MAAVEMTAEVPAGTAGKFEIFLMATPGLETALAAEATEHGFASARVMAGGVTVFGGWPEVWRANLRLRGAGRVTARLGAFRAIHLSQLDKRARAFPWRGVLRSDRPFRVEAACRSSRIYHSGAATERIERAIREELGATASADARVCVRARIDHDICTLAVDTSGEPLHKRGHKQAVSAAPMRETMAALLLRQCGYDGREPVVDPMCGSGTFVIEAAETAAGLLPGRARHFAFEELATFDETAWQTMRNAAVPIEPAQRFYGCDRDAGAIRMSRENAVRAGVAHIASFEQRLISECQPPPGPPGLVMINPPYGDRIGDKSSLRRLYGEIGQSLLARFGGWRVGLVTTDAALAKATRLPFAPPSAPVSHGGLRIYLFATGTLG